MNSFDKLYKTIMEEVKPSKQCIIKEDWDWKHPFTFNKSKQQINKLKEGIKDGSASDILVMEVVGGLDRDNSKSHGGDIEETIGIAYAGKDVDLEKALTEIKKKIDYFRFKGDKWYIHHWSSNYFKDVKNYPTKLSDGTKVVWSDYGVSYDQISTGQENAKWDKEHKEWPLE